MKANFQTILRDCGNADQYFFPGEHSHWKQVKHGQRFTFRPGRKTKSQIGGIRLQAHDPSGRQPSLERQSQYDLSKAIVALIELRKHPDYGDLVLSRECTRAGREAGHGRRVKLGLTHGGGARFENDGNAARLCHRRILAAARWSGLVPVEGQPFDPATGLPGLKSWAETVRFRRRLPRWPLWLLLIPLLLWIPKCETNFFGTRLKTRSFILIIDHSPSMGQTVEAAKLELKSFLAELNGKRGLFSRYYVNVIAFNDTAHSAFGELRRLDDEVAKELETYLDGLQLNAGTRLQSALELAAKEVTAHGKPTTLFVVTDAEDNSIPGMLQTIDDVRDWFKPVKTYLNATTPNVIFNKNTDANSLNAHEKALKDLTGFFEGEFGNTGDSP